MKVDIKIKEELERLRMQLGEFCKGFNQTKETTNNQPLVVCESVCMYIHTYACLFGCLSLNFSMSTQTNSQQPTFGCLWVCLYVYVSVWLSEFKIFDVCSGELQTNNQQLGVRKTEIAAELDLKSNSYVEQVVFRAWTEILLLETTIPCSFPQLSAKDKELEKLRADHAKIRAEIEEMMAGLNHEQVNNVTLANVWDDR